MILGCAYLVVQQDLVVFSQHFCSSVVCVQGSELMREYHHQGTNKEANALLLLCLLRYSMHLTSSSHRASSKSAAHKR